MPLIFTINKSRHILEQQWTYLVNRGRDNDSQALKKFLVTLAAMTFLYLLLYFLTAANDLITLKVISGVLIALGWSIVGILYVFYRLKNFKSKKRLQLFLASITENQLNYSVQIDEDRITIVSSDQSYELPWEEFDCFGLHNETVYVFNEKDRMKSLYWDRSEMGNEAFLTLVELLQKKLVKRAF